MAKKRTIAGNWKMHGSKAHLKEFVTFMANNSALLHEQVDTILCPPFPYLDAAATLFKDVKGLKLGAQDVSAHQEGAFTGQVAASMLSEVGCQYVIVGHSERRQFNHENDELVAAKFIAAKAAGLTPILCVGETKEQRMSELTNSVVIGQLQALLAHGVAVFDNAMIAYEPIWAIGTGLTATPEQAQAVHRLLRETLAEYDATLAKSMPILYGGSVKATNAKGLFAMPDIDGALVGGASLSATEFLEIANAAI
ncbi:MAG: triose-phosphate isomerase [Proteobacteria bacterium]|nr:triose-phosphate isomerase [Pseudomonadota bacterium]